MHIQQGRKDISSLYYVRLTFPGEQSSQKLVQAVPGISAILGLVVVSKLA